MKTPSKQKKGVWTDADNEYLKENYPIIYTSEICTKLGRSYTSVAAQAYKLGLKKSTEFKQMEYKKQGERLRLQGKRHQYAKGHTPHNKGKKVSEITKQLLLKTTFKKGNKPHNAYDDWQEVIRKDSGGKSYILIKVPGYKKLKHKHVYIWQQANGPVAKGYNIVFKDGNQMNCQLNNLECISNAELMQRNTIQRFPPELQTTIRLVKKLKRTIYAKEQD
jgi:HNH endonuclease